jgi:ribosome-associated toxin RatA of RatAB toxin-antitoxin module
VDVVAVAVAVAVEETMPAARHQTEIDATPDKVMAVITDFEAYPSFLPEMEEARILSQGEGTWDVRFSVKVVRRFSYTLRLVKESPTRVRWTLLEGSFKVNNGGWDLEPLDDGQRTRAVYTIDLQVGMFVPGNILRSLVERSLPDTVTRFKEETQRRG